MHHNHQPIDNFGKNVRSTPAVYAEPKSVDSLLELLDQHRDQSIRAIASGHAWSRGIETDGLLVNLKKLAHVQVDQDTATVRVGAGCQIKTLLAALQQHGLTLPSVGLIDEQTVAGATATGTHGSGKSCLSQYIRRVWIAHFDAATDQPVVTEIDSGPELHAAQCSLGLLGVVVEIEFECRPAYRVEEHSAKHACLTDVLAAESEYPLQQFFLIPWSWHWLGQHRRETNRPKQLATKFYRAYWHLGIDWGLHLIVLLMYRILRARFLVSGFYRFLLPIVLIRNWKVVDDSSAMLTMEHELFRHIEIELFVKRSHLPAALEHVRQTITAFGGSAASDDQPLPDDFPAANKGKYFHHYPICVRRVLTDDTLISATSALSPDDTEDWYAVSCISYDAPNQRSGFYAFAEYLLASMADRFDARCHWGKYSPPTAPNWQHLYPQMDRFQEIVSRFDASGRFANLWCEPHSDATDQ